MAAGKKQNNGATEKVQVLEPQFSKEQITASKKYCTCKDLLEALLDEGKRYTHEMVDKLIDDYRKGQVK